MTGPGEDAVLQAAFHDSADRRRFFNRRDNPFIAARETALAVRIVQAVQSPVARALDIGCGEGANLAFLHDTAPTVQWFGADFSAAKIAFAASVSGDRFGLACANALALPFADASFDLVVCRDLLHHVNWDRAGVLAEAARVTRPGGTIVVIESDGRRFLGRLFQLLIPAERGGRASVPDSLLQLAAPFGPARLERVEASFLTRALAYFIGWPAGRWTRKAAAGLYRSTEMWATVVARFVPRSRWIYMMMVIQPGLSAKQG